jgi:hypothetical protein
MPLLPLRDPFAEIRISAFKSRSRPSLWRFKVQKKQISRQTPADHSISEAARHGVKKSPKDQRERRNLA